MRFLPLLLPLLFLPELFALAAPPDRLSAYPRLDRRDRLGAASASGPLLSMPLVASGASECDGATPAGLTFTRASAATCTRSDGTVVSLASNQPRVTARGLLVEGAATNLVLHSSDPAGISWTRSGLTCTKTATSPDGAANSASRCTVAAGTGTALQSLTAAAATRATSLYLRGLSGPCITMDVTRDGGATWTPVMPGASWTRYAPSCLSGDSFCTAVPALTSGIANPSVGIRLGATCAVDIAYVQDEAGSYATSPIATAGTAATRAGEDATFPKPPGTDTAGCAYVTTVFPPVVASNMRALAAGINNTPVAVLSATGLQAYDGTNTTTLTVPALGGRPVRAGSSWAGAVLTLHSVTDGVSSTGVYDGSWAGPDVRIGSQSASTNHVNGFIANLNIDNTTTGCSQ